MNTGMTDFEHHTHSTHFGLSGPAEWAGDEHWHRTASGPTSLVKVEYGDNQHQHLMQGLDGKEYSTSTVNRVKV